ncbi:zinc metalloproteinase-disintegrin-like batroxstatin-2 [Bombina bombina]|uniref:zinc metalloproteinase-disintegrin-like batroxstatin-2 n=1 Tax=Bombina bombina TaxID=8345 RepID=UPI00235A952E|nr:zinc metalloproteinase-disintegrin-like batroxstatin-2 [Bombina bombina]
MDAQLTAAMVMLVGLEKRMETDSMTSSGRYTTQATGSLAVLLWTNSKYADVLQYELTIDGNRLVIHVEKTKDLVSESYSETHYLPNGTAVTTFPKNKTIQICQWKTKTPPLIVQTNTLSCPLSTHDHATTNMAPSTKQQQPPFNSLSEYYKATNVGSTPDHDTKLNVALWVKQPTALRSTAAHQQKRTARKVSGAIHTRGRRYLIEPLNQTDHEAHVVFESKEDANKTCGVTGSPWKDKRPFFRPRAGTDPEKEAFLKAKKYIQLLVVADLSFYKKYSQNIENVKKRIFEIINYVNTAYKAINTFVALIGVEIWTTADQIQVVSSVTTTLENFSSWRKTNLLPRKPHDNAQLLTNMDFEGTTVGYAYIAALCSDDYSAGVIQDSATSAMLVAITFAHELGHNLGMEHDTSDCTCSASTCIMSVSVSSTTPLKFSSCSLKNYEQFQMTQMPMCMRDVPQLSSIQAPPVCGNMFTEQGEDCDCGTAAECTNTCCDAATCKLKATAKCAEGECCKACQIEKAGVVCRASKDDCDLSDLCNGSSPLCPDRFKMNGYSCKTNQGYCYNGKCQNHLSQCVALWGTASTVGTDSCFQVNTYGMEYGYCTKSDGKFIACAQKDVKCGVLFCIGGTEKPTISASYITYGTCRGVIGSKGMVQNGTRCGDGLVCSNGYCITPDSAYATAECSTKCPAHSVQLHSYLYAKVFDEKAFWFVTMRRNVCVKWAGSHPTVALPYEPSEASQKILISCSLEVSLSAWVPFRNEVRIESRS